MSEYAASAATLPTDNSVKVHRNACGKGNTAIASRYAKIRLPADSLVDVEAPSRCGYDLRRSGFCVQCVRDTLGDIPPSSPRCACSSPETKQQKRKYACPGRYEDLLIRATSVLEVVFVSDVVKVVTRVGHGAKRTYEAQGPASRTAIGIRVFKLLQLRPRPGQESQSRQQWCCRLPMGHSACGYGGNKEKNGT